MQKIATRIFIYASIVFGLTGICLAVFGAQDDNASINRFLMRILMVCVFVILPSFALSIASKYLNK